MMLADLGASVVKVESLEGDSFRELPGFFGWNRGKRSLAVNLKTPEGREVVERLAREGDVLMENRSEEHTSELQSQSNLVCRLLLGKKKDDNFTRRRPDHRPRLRLS